MLWKETDKGRPRNWRWLRIRTRSDADKRATRRDDVWVHRGVRFLAGLRRLDYPGRGTVAERKAQHYARFRDISQAYEIEVQGRMAKWAIEALLMAGDSPDDIAEDLCRDGEVIDAYEALFFDVRDRLQHGLWVRDELLSPAVLSGMAGRDHDFLWKFLGYLNGPELLRELLWSVGPLSDSVKDTARRTIEGQAHRNALGAVVSRQINGFTSPQIMQEYGELLKIEKEEGSDGAVNAMQEGATMLLSAISVTVAPQQEGVFRTIEAQEVNTVIKRLAGGGQVVKELPEPVS